MIQRIGMRLSVVTITLAASASIASAQPPPAALPPAPPPAALPPAAAPPPPPAAQPPAAQPPAFQPPVAQPPAAQPPAQPPGTWSPPATDVPAGAIVMPPDYLTQPGRYPRKQPYDEGVRTPVGYHEGKEPRRGLFIAGIATFAGVYGGCALVGGGILAEGEAEGAWLFVPIGGPIAYAAAVGDNNNDDRGVIIGMTILTMAQTAGVAMTIAGLAAKRTVWVRNDVVAQNETLVPTVRVGAGWASVGVDF
jgi:hypothetical protein